MPICICGIRTTSENAVQTYTTSASSLGLHFLGKLILAGEVRRDAWFIGLHNLTVVAKVLEFHVPAARSYVSIAVESK
jgi:hypothetical protein